MSVSSLPLPPSCWSPSSSPAHHHLEEKIVFNQLLGLKVTSIAPQQVVARIDMRPELVGHYAYNRIHGGVISAGLDAMGGWP